MKKALAIGLAAVMAVSMSAPVFAEDEGKGIAKEDLKVGVIYILSLIHISEPTRPY